MPEIICCGKTPANHRFSCSYACPNIIPSVVVRRRVPSTGRPLLPWRAPSFVVTLLLGEMLLPRSSKTILPDQKKSVILHDKSPPRRHWRPGGGHKKSCAKRVFLCLHWWYTIKSHRQIRAAYRSSCLTSMSLIHCTPYLITSSIVIEEPP